MIATEFADKVWQLLASVGETDEVVINLDFARYNYQVLDSMRTVQLILMIEEQFGLKFRRRNLSANFGTRREL